MPKGRTDMPAGPGRPKGCVNKATIEARQAIAQFVDGNAHRLTEWLDAVAVTNPSKAFELFQSVIEYHVPKLARTEMTGKDGKDLIPPSVEINLVRPNATEPT